jgi:hypothetical protein
MWTRHARSTVLAVPTLEHGTARWRAEHDGYSRRRRPAVHRRSVELDSVSRELKVVDEVVSSSKHPCRLAFHLGPQIEADLVGHTARLTWTNQGWAHAARLELPADLSWSAHRGQTDPPLGWYSAGFGRRVPAHTLLGTGLAGGASVLTTVLRFST